MKIHLTNGLEAEIDEAEAERITGELAMLHGAVETNEAFTNRALDNIEHMTGFRPKSEAELKELLYHSIPGPTRRDIELLYETMEYIVGMHSAKTKTKTM